MTQDKWWRGATLYQIYPRSFNDSNGDGIGDLKGITQRLDYVASLNVDGIWLSPFFPSPMLDFGYDVTDLCSIEPTYGTLDDFYALVDRAHELDLKIIIDAVLNHTSIEHEWFQESRESRDNPKSDYYQWCDGKPDGSPPNNWISRFAEPQWTWCPVREQYYRHQYMKEQPALNLDNEEVVEERLKFMRKWLDRGVDGIRFDAVTQYYADPDQKDNPPADPSNSCLTPTGSFSTFSHQIHEYDCNDERSTTFVRSLMDEVRCAGCTFAFGEIDTQYRSYDTLERLTGDGLFDAAYTPHFMEASLCPSEIGSIIEAIEERHACEHHVWALTNHDASRAVSRWLPEGSDDQTRERVSRLAIALLIALPGQLTFFQGEELGLPDAPYGRGELKDPQGVRFWPKGKGRDPIRHPFPWNGERNGGFSEGEPWLPVKDDLVALNRQAQEDDDGSVLNHWRRAIDLRRKNDVLRCGPVEIIKSEDAEGILGLRRHYEGNAVQAWFKFAVPNGKLPEPEGNVLLQSEGGLDQPFSFVIAEA
jgi:alpha-glucosidase